MKPFVVLLILTSSAPGEDTKRTEESFSGPGAVVQCADRVRSYIGLMERMRDRMPDDGRTVSAECRASAQKGE